MKAKRGCPNHKNLAQQGLTSPCHFGILVEVEVEVEHRNYQILIIKSTSSNVRLRLWTSTKNLKKFGTTRSDLPVPLKRVADTELKT